MRRHKITKLEITFLGAVGFIVIFLSNLTLHKSRVPHHDVLYQASEKTAKAYSFLKILRLEKEIPIDSIDDPAQTGLIGKAASIITTSVGELEAKQTSVNPNWAAAIINYLTEAGVHPGEAVIVSMTGSFPGLDIAAIIAIVEYGAVPVWAISDGASSWGANIVGFSWLEMEEALQGGNFFPSRAIAASVGGNNNIGGGMDAQGRAYIRSEILSHGIPLIESVPLSKAIEETWRLLRSAAGAKKIALYINIGGGLTSLGTSRAGDEIIRPGLNSPHVYLDLKDEPVQGMVSLFLKDGVPVLNILDVKRLARQNKLPIAPVSTPLPGQSELFEHYSYTIWINLMLLVGYAFLVIAFSLGLVDTLFNKHEGQKML
ncbi:MAG: poly-gamma-glutamate system protein [Chitinivibrionales bacterium]|nr:poly-gamma-glutamate system protein [Chitinivibrionales bacterium]